MEPDRREEPSVALGLVSLGTSLMGAEVYRYSLALTDFRRRAREALGL